MKKYLYLLFTVIIMISGCENNTSDDYVKNKKEKEEEVKTVKKVEKEEITAYNYVSLFFNVSKPIKKDNNGSQTKDIDIEKRPMDLDYKVIIDYEVEGVRYIKLRNIRNGKVYKIRYGDKTGEIILIERRLRYYIFKIGNTTLKVER